MTQMIKNPLAVWETWVESLDWEDPLEESVATYSSILAWRIPMDRGAWRALTVHGVTKSRTRLSGCIIYYKETKIGEILPNDNRALCACYHQALVNYMRLTAISVRDNAWFPLQRWGVLRIKDVEALTHGHTPVRSRNWVWTEFKFREFKECLSWDVTVCCSRHWSLYALDIDAFIIKYFSLKND